MMLLLAYARERLFTTRVASAVCLVVFGAAIARGSIHPATVGMDLARTLVLIAAFRAWDDVMDRARDRIQHPRRISARIESVRPLQIFAAVAWLAAAILTWTAAGGVSLSVLFACTAGIAAWYRLRVQRSALGDHLLLGKYAAFTFVLSGRNAFTLRGLLAATLVYLAATVYEWSHDADSPVSFRIRSIEAVLLAAAVVAVLLSTGGMR